MEHFEKALIESTAYAVIAADPSGLITVFNRAAEQLLGYSAAEVVGKTSPAPFHVVEEVVARAEELSRELGRSITPGFDVFVAQALITGKADERPWTYVRKDGSTVPVFLSVTALRNDDGTVQGFLGIARDASELSRAQHQATENANRLRAVFEASHDGMLVIDETGKILDCNSAALRFTGYGRGELLGSLVTRLMSDEHARAHDSYVSRFLTSGRSNVIGMGGRELDVRRKDGSFFRAEISVTMVSEGSGQGHVFVGTIRDLTEKLTIMEERSRLLAIMEQTPDFIGIADLKGKLIYQNRSGLRMVGWSDKEDLGAHGIPDVHPRWAAKRVSDEAIPHALEHGTWIGESALLDPRGTEIPVSQVVIAHRDDRGSPIYFSTIMRDLREERAAQAAMSKTLAHIPGLVFSFRFDNGGKCCLPFCSIAAEELLGVGRDELSRSAERFLGRVHEDDIELFESEMRASAATGNMWNSRFRYRHPSGVVLWYAWQAQPGRDPDGILFHGYCVDVTEQVATSQRLEQALSDAKAATQAKSEFLATMSHEIRTPLNGVLGMADLLARTELDEEQSEFVETIRTSGDALLTLINDILDFSKIEAGKLTVESIAFSPQKVVAEVVKLFQDSASRKGLTLITDCQLSPEQGVLGDPARVRQIVLNLVSNAIKFTERGNVCVSAQLQRSEGSSRLCIAVTDSGIGMTPVQLAQLGQAFTQGDSSTTRRYGGTGLGLSICYNLAKLMGGTIEAVSSPETGSTFVLSFPVQEVTLRSGFTASETSPTNAQGRKLNRVLVAEDNAMNRRLVGLILRDFAYVVDMAENGNEAVLKYSFQEYDVVLMDGQMPEMDGKEATRRIRSLELEQGRGRTPIIALTANALPGDREEFLAAGMDEYLTKPLRADDLRTLLNRLHNL